MFALLHCGWRSATFPEKLGFVMRVKCFETKLLQSQKISLPVQNYTNYWNGYSHSIEKN